MLKPAIWIEQLNTAIGKTQCKLGGKNVPLENGLDAVANEFLAARSRNAAVWWVGNGGSAALCAHFAQDLLNKIGIRSTALTDAALLSCMANDYGFPEIYRRPLLILAQPGDVLVAISSSGKSENILRCADLALEKDLRLITVSGFESDNPLWGHQAQISIYMECQLYGHAEVGHASLLHAVIETMALES